MSEYIITCDDEVALWVGNDVESMRPLVRCRDCVYMHAAKSWLGMDVYECWLYADPESGALGKERTEPNGFCAWGERREDD